MRLVPKIFPILGLAAALASCGDSGREAEPAPQNEAAAQEEPAGRLDRSLAGTSAPTTRFQDPEGDDVTLADFRGKPLLVNLWATWCAPCIVEMPTLDALAERETGVQVLAVSQDLNGKEKVEAFFAERNFKKLEPYLDPESQLAADLKVDTLPTTIFYDAQGKELWRMHGIEEWTGPKAAALLKEAKPTA
jgi:thiol-disulfide isomerase/thioredoxin